MSIMGEITPDMAARTALLGLIMEIEKPEVDVAKLKQQAALARPLVRQEELVSQWRAGSQETA